MRHCSSACDIAVSICFEHPSPCDLFFLGKPAWTLESYGWIPNFMTWVIKTELPTIMISVESLWFSVMPLHPYSENYDKSAFSHNSSIWCSSDTVFVIHCITWLVFRRVSTSCRLFSITLWHSSHGSCSRRHGLKVFAAPANRNGYFFQEDHEFCGGEVFYLQGILSFILCFLIQI